jgi:hypothetical protein
MPPPAALFPWPQSLFVLRLDFPCRETLIVLAGQLAKRESSSSMTRGIESAEEAR